MTKEYFLSDGNLPLVIEGNESISLPAWLASNRDNVIPKLHEFGAVLFRGFRDADFQKSVLAFGDAPLDYNFRSTPRQELANKIYTSTEYPADQEIVMHNENSYYTRWPMKLWFFCDTPSKKGGETPLVDSRKMYQALNRNVVERFETKQLLYVRNYIPHFDLSWQNVFQTEDRGEMENFCKSNSLDYEWINENHFRTRHVAQSVAKHPVTQERVWFNQAHLFHYSNLNRDLANYLVSSFGEGNLPRNVYFNEGEGIQADDLEHVRQTYQRLKCTFSWQKNDLLLVDNMIVAHGRHPYEGPRKILVAMTESSSSWQYPVLS